MKLQTEYLLFISFIGKLYGYVIELNENIRETGAKSFAQYNNEFLLPKFSLTICFRFYLLSETGNLNWLYGYSISSNPDKANMYLNHTSSELAFCLSGSRGFENCFKVPYKPFEIRKKWYHSCVVLTGLDENSVFAKVQIWSQGKLQLTKEFTTILDPVLDGNGILILGQEQDSYGGGFDKFQSFSGQIAQFNMFTRALSEEEILSLYDCDSDLTGDLVQWTPSRWSLQDGAVSSNINYRTLCQKTFAQEVILIPDTVTYDNAEFICNFLSGEVHMVDDPASPGNDFYTKVKNEIDLQESYCSLPSGEFSTWFGNKFDYNQKIWDGYNNAEKMRINLTLIKEPSSPEEICLTNEFGKFRPRKCKEYRFCAFCDKLPEVKPIYMKGFCEDMVHEFFDKEYFLDGKRNKRLFFRGVRNSFMYFQPSEADAVDRNGNWIIQSEKDDQHKLILDRDESSGYPFGRYSWHVGSNVSFCNIAPGGPMSLTFTSCPSETFTCQSGDCIPLANKCNSRLDCRDESDEASCSYLQKPPIYAEQLSPSSKGTEPLYIYLNVSILALPSIKTVHLQFTADYFVNMRWYDHRLLFKDLNDKAILNGVNKAELLGIWSPELKFLNALGPYQTVVDDLNICNIVLENPPTFDDYYQSVEYYKFDSEKNSLYLTREYYQDFSCEFDLIYYPFDTQMCFMNFAINGYTKEYISLRKDGIGVEYTGKKELLEYEIQMWEFFVINSSDASEVEIRIVFRRNIQYHIFGTFVQQIMLLLIGYLTFFFEASDFTDRIMVSLTLMLVIATIVSSIQATLPVTPYLKMIDIWLFIAMNMMVYLLVFHTFLEYIIKKEDNNNFAIMDVFFSRKNSKWGDMTTSSTRPTTASRNKPVITEEDHKMHEKARKYNNMGKYGYLTVVVVFQVIFWIVAIFEFMRPAEAYLKKGLRD